MLWLNSSKDSPSTQEASLTTPILISGSRLEVLLEKAARLSLSELCYVILFHFPPTGRTVQQTGWEDGWEDVCGCVFFCLMNIETFNLIQLCRNRKIEKKKKIQKGARYEYITEIVIRRGGAGGGEGLWEMKILLYKQVFDVIKIDQVSDDIYKFQINYHFFVRHNACVSPVIRRHSLAFMG